MHNNMLFQNNPFMANNSYHSAETQRLRELQEMNKLERISSMNVDKKKLKEAVIQPKKIKKTSQDKAEFEKELKNAETRYRSKDGKDYGTEIRNYWKMRNNDPYKIIIKDPTHFKKSFKSEKDLIVHRVTQKDKEGVKERYFQKKDEVEDHDKELKVIYAPSKETEYKKKFEYNHVYKYRVENDTNGKSHDKLKKDKIKYYKKMQEEEEKNKKNKDDIISELMNNGIFNPDELDGIANFTQQIQDDDSEDSEYNDPSDSYNDSYNDSYRQSLGDIDAPQDRAPPKKINIQKQPTKKIVSAGNKTSKIIIKPVKPTRPPQNSGGGGSTTQHSKQSSRQPPKKISMDDKKVHIIHSNKNEPSHHKSSTVTLRPQHTPNIVSNKNDDKYAYRSKKKVFNI